MQMMRAASTTIMRAGVHSRYSRSAKAPALNCTTSSGKHDTKDLTSLLQHARRAREQEATWNFVRKGRNWIGYSKVWWKILRRFASGEQAGLVFRWKSKDAFETMNHELLRASQPYSRTPQPSLPADSHCLPGATRVLISALICEPAMTISY
jgi:hypothetical protein